MTFNKKKKTMLSLHAQIDYFDYYYFPLIDVMVEFVRVGTHSRKQIAVQ